MNCQQSKELRILIVADGLLNFTDDGKYGIGRAIKELDGSRLGVHSPWTVKIETAHRGTTFNTRSAFTITPELLRCKDELWLFGGSPDPAMRISSDETQAIENFMDRGGGVFATGDHSEMGCPLSGDLARVKWMRRWFSSEKPPSGLGGSPDHRSKSLSAIWPVPLDRMEKGSDEDAVGKMIWPAWEVTADGGARVHAVFDRGGGRAIRRLPDHAHEGVCANYRSWCDVPQAAQSEFEAACYPQPAAWALRGLMDIYGAFESEPVPYAVACAFDGHTHSRRLGRVLTECTWHHWVTQNLLRLNMRNYGDTVAYFRNVARWLAPVFSCRESDLRRFDLQGQLLLDELTAYMADPQEAPLSLGLTDAEAIVLGRSIRKDWHAAVGAQWADELARRAFMLATGGINLGTPKTAVEASLHHTLDAFAIGRVALHVAASGSSAPEAEWTSHFRKQASGLIGGALVGAQELELLLEPHAND